MTGLGDAEKILTEQEGCAETMQLIRESQLGVSEITAESVATNVSVNFPEEFDVIMCDVPTGSPNCGVSKDTKAVAKGEGVLSPLHF